MIGFYNCKTKEMQIDLESIKGEGKFHTQNIDDVLYINGYFLNADKSEEKACKNIKKIVDKDPASLQSTLFGCYTVCVRSDNGDWFIYNDLLSKMSVYYSLIGEGIIFSNSFFECARMVKKQGVVLTLDLLGLQMMNEHHIFYDDLTYLNEIKFLKPFQYICIVGDKVCVKELQIPDADSSITESAAIDECHKLFSEGINLEYHYNVDNNYKQVVTLSGGMDSRTTYLYGTKTGCGNELLFSYAQAKSVDFEFPLIIAENEKKEFFYHPMRDGQFLLDRDGMAERNEGQYNYAGTTGQCESLDMYDVSGWGLVHTGVGGGEIMGDVCAADDEQAWETFIATMSRSSDDKRRLNSFRKQYKSYNQFSNINDIRRCLNSHKIAKSFYVEYCSPFLYEPFFMYMLKVPYSIKKDRNLYNKWLDKHCKTTYRSTYRLGAKSKASYFFRRVAHHIIVKTGGKTKYDMNPFQSWEKSNPKMMKGLQKIFATDMSIIENSKEKELVEEFKKEWGSSSLLKKTYLLTSTWSIKELKTLGLIE